MSVGVPRPEERVQNQQKDDQAEVERLRRVDQYQISRTPPESAFDDIVGLLAELLNAPIAFFCITEAKSNWFKARIGLEIDEVPRAISFCDHTLKGEGVMVVPDASLDKRFSDRAAINLGQSLGITTLAEGIETPQQFELLLALGCQQGQGFLFSRAIPAKEIADKLKIQTNLFSKRSVA